MHSPYDIVIASAPKDYNKLPFVIRSIKDNMLDTFDNIYVITPTPIDFRLPGILQFRDEEVLEIDRSLFPHRPNWVFQQFLKLFQNVTQNERYLVVDADMLFNKPLNVFRSGKPIFYLGIDQMHKPYFDFMRRMFGLERGYSHSFINEFMLFDKNIVGSLLKSFNGSVTSFFEASIKIMTQNCYISEFELYGNFVHQKYPELYSIQKLNSKRFGKVKGAWSDAEIEKTIEEMKQHNAEVFTIHTWT